MTKKNEKIIRDFCNSLQVAVCEYYRGRRTVYYAMFQDDFIHNLRDSKDWLDFMETVIYPCRRLRLWRRESAVIGFYTEFLAQTPDESYDEFQKTFMRIYHTCLRRRHKKMGITYISSRKTQE